MVRHVGRSGKHRTHRPGRLPVQRGFFNVTYTSTQTDTQRHTKTETQTTSRSHSPQLYCRMLIQDFSLSVPSSSPCHLPLGVQGKLSWRTWHYPRVESYHTIQGWKAITRLSGFEGGVWVWRPGLPLFLESLWAAGIGWLETPSQKPSILYRNRTRNEPFLADFRADPFGELDDPPVPMVPLPPTSLSAFRLVLSVYFFLPNNLDCTIERLKIRLGAHVDSVYLSMLWLLRSLTFKGSCTHRQPS